MYSAELPKGLDLYLTKYKSSGTLLITETTNEECLVFEDVLRPTGLTF